MKSLHFLLPALLLLALYGSSLFGADATYLTYDKFIAEVDSGSVKSVTLDRFSQISGTYTVDGAERPFSSYGDTGCANDVLLTRLLKQKAVAVMLKEQKERDPFFGGGFPRGPHVGRAGSDAHSRIPHPLQAEPSSEMSHSSRSRVHLMKAFAGLRRSEARTLDWADIFESLHIEVKAAFKTFQRDHRAIR